MDLDSGKKQEYQTIIEQQSPNTVLNTAPKKSKKNYKMQTCVQVELKPPSPHPPPLLEVCLALFFMFTFVFLVIPLQKLTVLQHVKLPRGALHIHWCAVCRAADAPVRIWMSVTSYWTWIKQKKQTKIMLIKNSFVFLEHIFSCLCLT